MLCNTEIGNHDELIFNIYLSVFLEKPIVYLSKNICICKETKIRVPVSLNWFMYVFWKDTYDVQINQINQDI